MYEPDFNNKAIDRFMVAGESSHLHIIIIINKIDLDYENMSQEWASLYREIGHKVILCSKVSGDGIEKLKNEIIGNKNIFWGHSGVGKSSLLNKIFPGLNLEIGEISSFNTDKGTHKTVTSKMIKIASDTYVIDTPGVREIDPFGIKKKDWDITLSNSNHLQKTAVLILVLTIMNLAARLLKQLKIMKFQKLDMIVI